ncbi:MAG: hypothetical protein KI793_20995 [Rivularia sp. (in: Bacteria)]|nr:hypothetical protein [Rivularia sp. MS3]
MNKTIVHSVVGFENLTLLVFHTQEMEWQFRVISSGGEVFGERKLYYTPEAAEKAAREWLSWGD